MKRVWFVYTSEDGCAKEPFETEEEARKFTRILRRHGSKGVGYFGVDVDEEEAEG